MKNVIKSIVAGFFAVAAIIAQTPAPRQYFTIATGETVERELEGNKRHSYKIKLEARQFLRVEAEQEGVDVIFALYGKDGVNYFDVANNSEDKTEFSSGAVETAGEYELQVASMTSKTGKYRLRITDLRAATDEEINFTAGIALSYQAFMKTTSSSTAASVREAITLYEAAHERFLGGGDRSFVSRMKNEIGANYMKLGDTRRAESYFNEALAVAREIGDKLEISLDLSNLAGVHQRRGEWQQAYDFLLEALSLRRQINHFRGEMATLGKLGRLLASAGEPDRALEFYQMAIDIVRKKELSSNLEADMLENIGNVYVQTDKLAVARESFENALAIARENKSRRREAAYLNSLGRIRIESDDAASALPLLEQAGRIAADLDDPALRASVLRNLGLAQTALRTPETAIDSFEQALAIQQRIEDAQSIPETLLWTAHAEVMSGRLVEAQTRVEEAIAALERNRSRVAAPDARDAFSTNLQDFYGLYIEILMARHKSAPNDGFAVRALEASERARARGLLSLLGESETARVADPALASKELELKGLLATRFETLTRALAGKPDQAKIAAMRVEIENVKLELEQTTARIRAGNPRFAALREAPTLTLEEIRRLVVNRDTVLLEYALGERASYLWIVGSDGFQVVELPSRSRIEKTAKQFYDALTARNQRLRFETDTEFRERTTFADADFDVFSAELGRLVLAPAMPFIQGKRVVVVADGGLQYVPFAAIKQNGKFLVETNETTSLPSASVLAALRRDFAGRRPAPKTIALFADPIFAKDDSRIAAAIARDDKKIRFQNVSGPLLRDELELVRLPYTRREAELVGSLASPAQQLKQLDFAANRDRAQSPELANYRYLHFATHGMINSQMPELSGIVLSLFDERGNDRDGFLRAGDILGLNINAEMVVLSGCRTAFGREIKGEGLGGLTRGFFFAGARRVTVSLWDINDEATADLMGAFYREILGERKLAPAAALRHAQLAMLRSKRWRNPYYWSAFIMQGEPK